MADLGNEHIPVPADRNLQLNTANVGAALRIARPMGISRSPIPNELQVHNLEDGGVMVQYNCLTPAKSSLSLAASSELTTGS